jgi:hypothetical protein
MAKAVISIDVNLGTAKMILDAQKAKAELYELNTAVQGSARGAATELRVLEGNISNNTRAVAQFLTQTLKLGPVMAAVFPVIGAVALGGMIVNLGTKVAQFSRISRKHLIRRLSPLAARSSPFLRVMWRLNWRARSWRIVSQSFSVSVKTCLRRKPRGQAGSNQARRSYPERP